MKKQRPKIRLDQQRKREAKPIHTGAPGFTPDSDTGQAVEGFVEEAGG